jgi:hypothetical protein
MGWLILSEIAIPFARNELIKKLYTNGFINQVQFSRKSFADTQEPGKYKIGSSARDA